MTDININKYLKSLSEQYTSGNYDEVIDGFLSIKGKIPKDLFHYNLGSAFAKKGEYGAGRYHLELALQSGYWQEPVIKNINSILKVQSIKDISNSKLMKEKTLNKIDYISMDIFIFVSLVILLVSLFIRLKKIINTKVLIPLIVLALVPVGTKYLYSTSYKTAVVLENSQLYEGPSRAFESGFDIQAGSKIIIGKKSDDWFFIRYPESLSGWVNAKKLGFLE
ncbi:MAG: hypothetical protein GY909_11230 [Oligoflexia bacterium]|nr:hypothetical protein [Oligoflexia bacterium]